MILLDEMAKHGLASALFGRGFFWAGIEGDNRLPLGFGVSSVGGWGEAKETREDEETGEDDLADHFRSTGIMDAETARWSLA